MNISTSTNFSINRVEIEISNECNQACSYCPNSVVKAKEVKHMPLHIYQTLLNQLKKNNYQGNIYFHFYNEPLMSPHLLDWILLAKKKLPDNKIDIFTNGTLINSKDQLQKFFNAGVWRFNITAHSTDTLSKIAPIINSFGKQQKNLFKVSSSLDIIYSNRGGAISYLPATTPNILSRPCFIPHTNMVVTTNGDVLPCYEDFFQTMKMGNIANESLLNIWNSPQYIALRNTLKTSGGRKKYQLCSKCNNILLF